MVGMILGTHSLWNLDDAILAYEAMGGQSGKFVLTRHYPRCIYN